VSTHAEKSYPLTAVKFSRLTRRGVILGLSLPQVVTLAVAILTFVGSLYAGGGMILAWSAPVWATALGLTWVPVAGRKAIEWLPLSLHWLWRVTVRQTLFRRRVVKPRPAGTLSLPGDMAALRQYEDPETGAVMVHNPHEQTLTVLLEVTHPAFVLLDPGEQERRVSSWGRGASPACKSSNAPCPTPAPGSRSGGPSTARTTTRGPLGPTRSSSTVPAPPGNGTPPRCPCRWT